MKRLDRRTFVRVASVGTTGAILTACGNDPADVDLNPTMIPVEGAPPTLAPFATPGGEAGDATPVDTGNGEVTGDVVELEAIDPFAWSIYELEVAPGQVIQVTNTGILQHNFTVDELGIAEDLPNGQPVEITIPDTAPIGDTYEFYCSVPGHREGGMEGTLTIVEASATEGNEEAETEEATPEGTPEGASSEPVVLEALDLYQWGIGALTVAPGQVIQVVNAGLLEHDFVVDELGISVPLPVGEPIDVAVPDDASVGESYEFYCSVPGHREMGMEGTLTIAEADADTGPDAQSGPSEEVEAEPADVDDEVASLLDDPDVIALEASDPYNWSWKAIEAAPGQVIRVINLGVLEHDFVIDELDIEQELPFAEPIDIQIPDSASIGDMYLYYCSIPGHRERGMEGTLTIVETAATPVATPEATPQATPEATPVTVEETAGEAVVSVVTVDLTFEPSEFEIPANTDVEVTITNEGVLQHDFAVEELGIDSDLLENGQSTTVTINAEPGTYEFICTVPGHAQSGMVGTLTVV